MAGDWRRALERLERMGSVPSRWSILSSEVRCSYWDVLAYEHDGLAGQAAVARKDCLRCARQLRAAFDPHPDLGPAAADAMIGEAVQGAHADLARDLQQEEAWKQRDQPMFRPSDWREKRGRPRGYF